MRLFLAFAFLLLSATTQAQAPKSFSQDSIKFLEEMTAFMSNARKKETKEFMEQFEPIWYGGKFTEEQRAGVYSTCNFMLKKKLPAYPEFRSYLFSVVSFLSSNQTQDSFEAWQASVEKLIDSKNKRKLSKYLAFCGHLFEKRNLYESASTVWKASNANYQFGFDKFPVIDFPALNLICYSKGDSSVIYGTHGTYYPLEGKWKGEGGKVTWERAGFADSQVFATLNTYGVTMKSPGFEADSVVFTNSIYFSKPLLGKLVEKVLANVTVKKASYPRFASYNKRLQIPNIVEGIDYDGGFSQQGGKFLGSGTGEEKARLIFNYDGAPKMVAESRSFSIRTDKINAQNAEITLYLDEDSITHPGLRLSLLVKEREVSLVRDESGIGKTPFFNSYHDIDMFVEEVHWKIDNPTLDFRPLLGTAKTSAYFESTEYFQEHIFDRLQGIDPIHPLYQIKMCAKQYDTDFLYADEVAQFMGVSGTQVRPLLMQFSAQGFLSYDMDDNSVTIERKLYHYLNAKSKREDYDVLKFSSNVAGKANASINLLSNELTMRGVKTVLLSDSQNVYILPKGKELTMSENRNFRFTGIINAGRFEFFGKEFDFDYENFKMHMPNIDSMRVRVMTKNVDERGRLVQKRVITSVEHLNGELLIDHPGNKAGLKDKHQYPIFKSFKESYAFYQKYSIQGGAYKRNNFYFQLEPFVFDSLDNFPNASVRFAGTFASAGIFPEFQEEIYVQPDYSLGFVRPTPEDGFPNYGGKGRYYKDINLSHEGLRGDGYLEFLAATAESDDFIFYPDSMNTVAQSFVLEEQVGGDVEYPPTIASDVFIHWRPYRDFMRIRQTKDPFNMYAGQAYLSGELTLRPNGLEGAGLVQIDEGELESNLYKFKFSEFDADTSDFRLQALEESVLAFSTENVNAHVDMAERKADFISNSGGTFIDFPINEYICFMDRFSWYMESDDIELSADETVDLEALEAAGSDVALEGSKFISVHPEQDSLSFYSPKARYDIRKNKITCQEIQYIPVADARIYPDSGVAIIERRANMRPLENSEIVANNVTKYHRIYGASTKIHGAKKYAGRGKYDYKDDNKLVQTIELNKIDVDTAFQTVAYGNITEDLSFTLSPQYEYQGKVELYGNNPYLTFDGTARISHNCEVLSRPWFAFRAEIDPEEIYIPVDTITLDGADGKLASGFMLAQDSVHLYSAFLSARNNYSDNTVLPISGFLTYDAPSSEYRISNLQKLSEQSLPGDYLAINTSTCEMYGEGKLYWGTEYGRVDLRNVGSISYNPDGKVYEMDAMMVLDFFFVEKALDVMAKDLATYEGLKPINFDRPAFDKGLHELMDKETADKAISDLNLYGNFRKFPSELNKPIVLSELKLRWNPETDSYQSVGKIGVSNLFKKEVHKYVDGHIELIKKRSGDILHVYLELDPANYYYFTYARNYMNAFSGSEDFNNAIIETKTDKRKLKNEKGKAPYQFMITQKRKVTDFIKRFDEEE